MSRTSNKRQTNNTQTTEGILALLNKARKPDDLAIAGILGGESVLSHGFTRSEHILPEPSPAMELRKRKV